MCKEQKNHARLHAAMRAAHDHRVRRRPEAKSADAQDAGHEEDDVPEAADAKEEVQAEQEAPDEEDEEHLDALPTPYDGKHALLEDTCVIVGWEDDDDAEATERFWTYAKVTRGWDGKAPAPTVLEVQHYALRRSISSSS